MSDEPQLDRQRLYLYHLTSTGVDASNPARTPSQSQEFLLTSITHKSYSHKGTMTCTVCKEKPTITFWRYKPAVRRQLQKEREDAYRKKARIGRLVFATIAGTAVALATSAAGVNLVIAIIIACGLFAVIMMTYSTTLPLDQYVPELVVDEDPHTRHTISQI